jgi:quaternary ammonium compound-resistance protein SugE
MAWTFLILAGILEWGWPMGLKFAWRDGQFFLGPAVGAGLSMILSGLFLFLAQRSIAMGTAYAVWTGIGAVGTFFLGIWLLNEPSHVARYMCVFLIIAGIVGLKLTGSS